MAGRDDEQHFERFDMDNDYEGGEWVNGEFYYKSKRQKRMQTREEQIYGVFADDSDDSDGGGRRRKRRDGGDSGADYSRPVSFISTGKVVQDTTFDDEQEEGMAGPQPQPRPSPDRQRRSATPSEGVDERPSFATLPPQRGGLGLGAGGAGAGAGLGFASAGWSAGGAEPRDEDGEQRLGGGDEEEEGVMPSAFGKRVLAKAQQRLAQEQQAAHKEKQRTVVLAADPKFAVFEKHSKGIGLKLLEKMGYKPGEGLGRHKQGIAKPIEVKLRPKGMALGFGDREEPKMEMPKPPGAPAAGLGAGKAAGQERDTRDQRAQAPEGKAWKKRAKEARVRREYKTADQVLAEAADKPLQSQPILDMSRAGGPRVVTNMAALNEDADGGAGGERTPMPELQHNLRLLVDLAEAQIQKLDARLRHEQDTATLLARERQRLEDEEVRQADACSRLAAVAQDLEACRALPGEAPLALLAEAYRRLRERAREEYIMYGLAQAALDQVLPKFQALFRGWQPLAEPQRGVAELRAWRPLLESDTVQQGGVTALGGGMDGAAAGSGSDDPYALLVWEAVLPALRSSVLNGWQARDPEPLLAWLEVWEALLPASALGHLLELLVMPKLRAAVQEWEPRAETVPIHAWLFPWLPYLGPALEELYPQIRHKLDVALQAWHPSDGSALVLLSPWQRVWEAKEWDAFMQRAILPKLALALGQLDINPAHQALDQWQWVMAWREAISVQQMAALLERAFFPKWHGVLAHWLSHGANYDEVTRWYLGWKSALPQGLLDHERVRAQLNAALNTMNTYMEEGTLPQQGAAGASAGANGYPGAPAAADAAAAATAAAAAASAAARGLSMRDLIVRYAEEHNVEFVPKPGRSHEGLPVYSFGGVSVVLDSVQGMIRAQLGGRWAPATLSTLLQHVTSGGRAGGGGSGTR